MKGLKQLAIWIPPVAWMAVVLAMSSAQMSAENTGSILGPLLAWLGLQPAQVGLIHGLIRKAAHLTEYGILGALWRRALVRSEVVRPAVGAWLALAVSVACAVVDETHQSVLPSRTGAAGDVVLDSLGAVAGIVLARLGGWRAVDAVTGVLLWVAIVGGIGALVLDLAAGAGGGVLWFTVPAAAGVLVYRWRRSTSRG
jgi:VanZ family protein